MWHNASEVGVNIDGDCRGAVFRGSMEETGSGTPVPFVLGSGADGTEDLLIEIQLTNAGYATTLTDNTSNGSPRQYWTGRFDEAQLIGATIRPEITGARDDGTALADLLTKLDALGVLTDSTTAT
jgi:hypothetical protein